MKNHNLSIKPKGARGFGLVELLMGIAVMSILVTMVLPSFTYRNSAKVAVNRRNAQMIANSAAAASLAGAQFVVEGNLGATVDRLVAGVVVLDGTFKGRTFNAGSITAEAAEEAKLYLKVVGDQVLYTGGDASPATRSENSGIN